MRRMTKISIAVGAALSLGLAAAVVNAHPYGWGGGPGYGMHGYGMGPGMMGGYGPGYGMGPGMMGGYGPGYGMGPGMMGGYGYPGAAEERLAGLKTELGITAQQESAWQAFVDSAKQRDKNRQAWFDKLREARAAGSAPELLAQRTEIMKQQQGEMEAAATALKNLYGALTPEQRAIADQRLAGVGPGYGRGYRGGPGGRFR